MAAPVIYFAGGEDSELLPIGGNSVVVTTAGHFRSSYARCALSSSQPNIANVAAASWRVPVNSYAQALFWCTARFFNVAPTSAVAGAVFIQFFDSNQIVRLRMRNSTSNASGPWVFEKVDAAGTATQLGSNTTIASMSTGALQKLDCLINYSATGGLDVYIDNILVFTFSGDITTNSVTTLNGHDLGTYTAHANSGGSLSSDWSEVIVSDTDTRSLSLQTLAPVANGNTHNFNTGTPAAANVNESTLNDATFDGSSTAGQIDQYTIPAIVAGSAIVAVGVSARMAKGFSGPTKADLSVRSAGADFFSADQALGASWAGFQNWWSLDPATSATWNGLPANVGVKSVA